MSDGRAAITADMPAEPQSHPVWCDLNECTSNERGGAHHSAWMTIGPLSVTKLVARAYLYAPDGLPAPAAVVSFHYPVEDPEDIARNAGHDEDTASLVLPLDEVERLDNFLTGVLAASKEARMPGSLGDGSRAVVRR